MGASFVLRSGVKELATGKRISINGWNYWRVEEAGSSLCDVRAKFLEEVSNPGLEYCA